MTVQTETGKKEFLHQKEFLFLETGLSGSGYQRYAAAMYFHKRGIVSLELLEIYRRCCKFDSVDPVDLAHHEGIATVTQDDITFDGTKQE